MPRRDEVWQAAPSWVDDLKAHGPAGVGKAFGLQFAERPAPGNLSPCPSCGAERRHPKRYDRRGAVGLTRNGAGWRCHECDAGGDGLDLAARLTVGRVPAAGDSAWGEVRAACVRQGLCAGPGGAEAPRILHVPSRTPVAPVRPAGAAELWAAALPATEDRQVSAWLIGRGLDPGRAEDLGLVRALPVAGPIPTWARFAGRNWRESSHRLLVPLYGASGRLESVHARALAPREPNGRDKAASPAGAEVRGLVMADGGAVSMLRGGYRPTAIVIAEGPPDFLTWATRWSDADEDAPVVLGVIAGSWSDELAARLPSGMRVDVRTHRDDAGRKYADRICASLAARCSVFRPPSESPA